MTDAHERHKRYARPNYSHLEVPPPVQFKEVMHSQRRRLPGLRNGVAVAVLLCSANALAQGAGATPIIDTPIVDLSIGGGSEAGLIGVNLNPDVFGITDLIAPSADGSDPTTTPVNACEGIACGDNTELNSVELPGLLLLDTTQASNASCTDTDDDGICDGNDNCLGTAPGTAVLANGCGLSKDAPIVLSGVNFGPASSSLSPAGRSYLDEVVALIRELPQAKLIIEGHTDSQGSEADNLALSLRRAEAVYNYLTQAGVPKGKLAYRGLGEAFPLTPAVGPDGQRNDDADRINRRIELKLADDAEFNNVIAEMKAREQARQRELARREAARRQAESKQAQQQKKVEAAEQAYSEMLEFLDDTGSAEKSEQETAAPDSSEVSDESVPEYNIELVYPDQ